MTIDAASLDRRTRALDGTVVVAFGIRITSVGESMKMDTNEIANPWISVPNNKNKNKEGQVKRKMNDNLSEDEETTGKKKLLVTKTSNDTQTRQNCFYPKNHKGPGYVYVRSQKKENQTVTQALIAMAREVSKTNSGAEELIPCGRNAAEIKFSTGLMANNFIENEIQK